MLDSPEPQLKDLLSSDPSEDEQNTSSAPTKDDRLIAHEWIVRPDQCTYRFVRVDECRFVPNAFLADLSPQFIRRWLDKPPFAFSTKEPAGEFFRSMGILREPSNEEWISATANYEEILQSLPSDLVRAWVAIHVVAATLRSNSQQYAPLVQLKILPNGHWEPCATSNLKPAAYQYYLSLKPEVHKILALDPQETPALALMLALMRIPENSNDRHHVDARAVINMFWPSDRGQLRDITEPFFKKLAEDYPEDLIHRVVTVTTALRKLPGGNDAVTHVLAKKGGQLQLFPKGEVWVGADYGFPHIEEAAAGQIPIVAAHYGKGSEWNAFFESLCHTRPQPPTWQLIKEITFDSYNEISDYKFNQVKRLERQNVNTKIELPLGFTEFNNTLNYLHIFGTTFDLWSDVLEKGEFDYARACAFAKTISTGDFSNITSKLDDLSYKEFSPSKIYVTWIKTVRRRDCEPSPTIFPYWIELLRNKAWVPTKDGQVVKPKDVLLWPNHDNPDAPVADLDDATREGLEPLREAVNFGQSVPQYGPLDRLINAANRSETSNERLVALWRNALDDRELDIERLKQCAHDLDLIPVKETRCDGKDRVTSKRIVRDRYPNIALGRQDFGGFLVYVADTRLADRADDLANLFCIPKEPTANQAADYLEWVWSAVDPQDAVNVRNQVVDAWRIVAAEPSVWPKIKAIRENGNMQLFCRQPEVYPGRWLSLPSVHPSEPVWNNAPDKAACLRDSDGIWLEAWISKRKDINVDKLIELLGISRLSEERFDLKLNIDPPSGNPLMKEATQRLGLVIMAIQVHRNNEEEIEPATTKLTLHSAQSIKRTFRIDGKERSKEDLEAAWKGGETMYVVGNKSVVWATDLRPLVQQALELGGNARGLRFLDLIPLLDDDETFNRKFEQLCRELGVSAEDIKSRKLSTDSSSTDKSVVESMLSTLEKQNGIVGLTGSFQEAVESKADGSEEYVTKSKGINGLNTDGSSDSEGSGSNDHRVSGTHRSTHSSGPAPNKFLWGTGSDEDEERAVREKRLPKDDADARQKVVDYEEGEGREPTSADRYQAGYDVFSTDSEGCARKIEVKGLQGAWENNATVTMTGRQFDDARNKEGDWWLYVVDNLGTDHSRVIRIHNPAKRECRIYLYASHWRDKTEKKPPEALVGPDEGDA